MNMLRRGAKKELDDSRDVNLLQFMYNLNLLLLLFPSCSPAITPVPTPPPQSAPRASRPQETRRRGTQGQRGRTQLLLNQIIQHLQCLGANHGP